MSPYLIITILGALLTACGIILYDKNGGTSENNDLRIQGFCTICIMIGLGAFGYGLSTFYG